MNPKPRPSTGYKISGILDELSELLWELEADNKAEHIRYTKADVMSAVKIFMHVLSNVAIHKAIERGEKDPNFILPYGERIAKLTKDMTGVDTKSYYKTS